MHYATSYKSLIGTLDVSRTVSEILTRKQGRTGAAKRPWLIWTKQPTFGSVRGVLILDCGESSGFEKFLENDLPDGEKSHISDDLNSSAKTIYEGMYTSKMFTSM